MARLLAVAIAAVLIGSHWTATHAVACSGNALVGDDRTDPDADVIFTGTAVRVVDPRVPSDPMLSSFDTMQWTFVVDGVEKGHAPVRLTVGTPRNEGSCGFTFELGSRYRVVATDLGLGLQAWLFSGTQAIERLPNPPPVEGAMNAQWPNPLVILAIAGLILGVVVVFVSGERRRPASDHR